VTVVVEFYGGLKELAGQREWELIFEEEEEYNVRDILERLFLVIPELRQQLDSIAFAVGDELVDQKHEIHDGTRLSLLPPVSGG
jgi:molybdopterin converting factor small subunit